LWLVIERLRLRDRITSRRESGRSSGHDGAAAEFDVLNNELLYNHQMRCLNDNLQMGFFSFCARFFSFNRVLAIKLRHLAKITQYHSAFVLLLWRSHHVKHFSSYGEIRHLPTGQF
jgi:hypothetical protein